MSSQLYQCIVCDATWDAEGRWREGYEEGEYEFVPFEGYGECPECGCTETEAI